MNGKKPEEDRLSDLFFIAMGALGLCFVCTPLISCSLLGTALCTVYISRRVPKSRRYKELELSLLDNEELENYRIEEHKRLSKLEILLERGKNI